MTGRRGERPIDPKRGPGLTGAMLEAWHRRSLAHLTLPMVKLPVPYLNPRLPRRTDWYDSGEAQPTLHR